VQTGVTGSYTGSNATITNVGNGWYRCALYFTSSAPTDPYNQQIHLALADNDLTFAGTGTSGSYLWGAQFENGNLLGPYRKTEGSGFAVSGSNSMLDQMKFNLKNTGSFSGSFVGGWNPGYSGNRPNGVNGYMNTGLNQLSNFTTQNMHLAYYTNAGTFTDATAMAGFTTGPSNTLLFINGAQRCMNQTDNNFSGPTNINYGFYCGSRNTLTERKSFFNGASVFTTPTNATPLADATYYLGAIQNGAAAGYFGNFKCAFSTIGDGLTDYEAKALYWIVQKFQTTLGRQVY
jgi:hypothetical protein